jgi:acyl dehydratase
VGDVASKNVNITRGMIAIFADLVDDHAPVHFDHPFAVGQGFSGTIAHGFLISSLISGLLGEKLPGPNSVINESRLKFHNPVICGDTVCCEVIVDRIVSSVSAIVLKVSVSNLESDLVYVSGTVTCSIPNVVNG